MRCEKNAFFFLQMWNIKCFFNDFNNEEKSVFVFFYNDVSIELGFATIINIRSRKQHSKLKMN